jgi:proline dehydrogenase
MLGQLAKRAVLWVWRPIERRAARAYLAGPALADALHAADRIAGRGYGIAIGFWNPDEADPREVAVEGLAAVDAMRARGHGWHLSIKAPALGYSLALVQQIAVAHADGARPLHFDSHECEAAEATLALAAAAQQVHPDVGVTIPGRWRRSGADAELAAEQGLRVRVVKGQYADPGAPRRDLSEGFLAVVDRLAGRARHVSVATHDERLAAEAVARLSAAGTPHDFELLLGMPVRRVAAIARVARVPVRMYVPYGEASLRYGLPHLARDPRHVGWLARDLLLGRREAPAAAGAS